MMSKMVPMVVGLAATVCVARDSVAAPDGTGGGALSDSEVDEVVEGIGSAVQAGDWPMVVAFAIMLGIYALRRVGLATWLPSKAVPWLAAVFGVAGQVVTVFLTTTDRTFGEAASRGVLLGTSAVGLWEMIFRHLLKVSLPGDPGAEPVSEGLPDTALRGSDEITAPQNVE